MQGKHKDKQKKHTQDIPSLQVSQPTSQPVDYLMTYLTSKQLHEH